MAAGPAVTIWVTVALTAGVESELMQAVRAASVVADTHTFPTVFRMAGMLRRLVCCGWSWKIPKD